MAFPTPKYRLHKGSGQALVQINGERIYRRSTAIGCRPCHRASPRTGCVFDEPR